MTLHPDPTPLAANLAALLAGTYDPTTQTIAVGAHVIESSFGGQVRIVGGPVLGVHSDGAIILAAAFDRALAGSEAPC